MSIDGAFWMIFKAISQREIRFNDFNSVGISEDYYDYYYAEDNLYVIRDRIFDNLEFIRAKSPKEALQKFREVRNDIARAMVGADDEEMGEHRRYKPTEDSIRRWSVSKGSVETDTARAEHRPCVLRKVHTFGLAQKH